MKVRSLCFSIFVCAAVFAHAQDGMVNQAIGFLGRGQVGQSARLLGAKSLDQLSPMELHLRGVSEILDGKAKQAEATFSKAISLESANPNTLSGLEEISAADTAFGRALQLVKPVIGLSAGAASAQNNRGVSRFLQGNFMGALEDFDKAAVMLSEWGVPWTNGSMALLQKGDLVRAIDGAKRALDLKEQTPQAYVALAEAELAANQFDRAGDDIQKALSLNPNNPYALLAQAKLSSKTGNSREAERAIAQALSFGPFVTVDSDFSPASGRGTGLSGQFVDEHIRLFHHGLSSKDFAYRALALFDRLKVEGRSRGLQTSTYLEGAISSPIGSIYGSYRDVYGGRPGLTGSETGLDPTPSGWFDFEQMVLLWQKRFDLDPKSNLTLHAGYRDTRIRGRLSSSESKKTPLTDEQWLLEARWDRMLTNSLQLSVGGSMSEIKRGGVGGTPTEPAEQIFSQGKTRLATVYANGLVPLTNAADLLVGAIGTSVNGDFVIQPIGEVRLKLAGGQALKLNVKNRSNESIGNLVPLTLVPNIPQRNAIDRKVDGTQAFNSSPTLLEDKGRHRDYELAVEIRLPRDVRIEGFVFYRDLKDFRTSSSDPRQAPDMILTPLSKGRAGGIGTKMRFPLSQMFVLRLNGAFQSSWCDYRTPTFKASDYPLQTPTSNRELPNFANFQGSAIMDWIHRGTTLSLEVQYIGERRRAVTVPTLTGDVTYLSDSRPTTGIHVHAKHLVGRNLALNVSLYNLTQTGFYPGYGGGTTAVIGFDYRF